MTDKNTQCPSCGSKRIRRQGYEVAAFEEEFDSRGQTEFCEQGPGSEGALGVVECECLECANTWYFTAGDLPGGSEVLEEVFDTITRALTAARKSPSHAPHVMRVCSLLETCRHKLQQFGPSDIEEAEEDNVADRPEDVKVGGKVSRDLAFEVLRHGGTVRTHRGTRIDMSSTLMSLPPGEHITLTIDEYELLDKGDWDGPPEPEQPRTVEKQLTLLGEDP